MEVALSNMLDQEDLVEAVEPVFLIALVEGVMELPENVKTVTKFSPVLLKILAPINPDHLQHPNKVTDNHHPNCVITSVAGMEAALSPMLDHQDLVIPEEAVIVNALDL